MRIFETIDSTQLEAKRLVDTGLQIDKECIFAFQQTSGQTTKAGIPWHSPLGNLYTTFIFNVSGFDDVKKIQFTFCSSLATRDTILEFIPDADIKFKWPNDLLLKENKVCGILDEVYNGYLLIGIGLNLLHSPEKTFGFPATSIKKEYGVEIKPDKFAEVLTKNLDKYIEIFKTYGFSVIKTNWKKNAYKLGDELLLRDLDVVKFEDIDNNGCIVGIKKDSGQRIICSSDEVLKTVKNAK